MGLTCSVLGASGYSGGELLRLLSRHPSLVVEGIAAGSRAGEEVRAAHPHLVAFERFGSAPEVSAQETDVCFSCLPGGVLNPGDVAARVIVDLADDHRWEDGWLYGLTEEARDNLPEATRVANPGCYPTATLLALLPFARAGLIEPDIVVDALSGVSGAGRDPRDQLLYAGLEGSVGAYGTTTHRHIPEMESALTTWGGLDATLSFTPHLVPMARGLLVTARARHTEKIDDAAALGVLHAAYDEEPFVHVIDSWPQTKAVAGSNHAHVHARVDERAGLLICAAAIDNLGKGAAGQALQNANLALGLEETAGLEGFGVWP